MLYELVLLTENEVKNGTARTILLEKDPFSKMKNHGSLLTEANLEDAFMICEVRFDKSVHLGIITPTWNSPTQQNVEHTDRYIFDYWRNELLHTVGSRLTLRYQSDDQDAYGEYSCIFTFKDVGQVEFNVYLKIAPILTLPLIPPPPPLLETGLANPACFQDQASANLTALWHQACKIVVAYPPVSASDHAWNWSNGEAALSTIRSVTGPQLTEEKIEALERLYKQADEEQHKHECPGLLVRQNTATFSSHQTPTLFWCYAENEVGKTVVRWPQDYHASRLPTWAVWFLAIQATGAIITVSILTWCFCCRHSYRRRLVLDRISQWTFHHLFIQSPRQDDCRLVMVGPADDNGDLGNGSTTPRNT